MKRIFAVFLLVVLMEFPSTVLSESIVNEIALRERSISEDAQGMYIAALCGNGIIRKGAFGQNVDILRAVCSQINYPSAETIDCILSDCDSLYIRAVYAFGDVARVAFYTEPILIQALIPFCRTERVENKAEETDYVCFSTQSKEYYIDIETLLTEAWNWATMRSVLTILTPYESEKMPPEGLHDVDITIFDYLSVPTI